MKKPLIEQLNPDLVQVIMENKERKPYEFGIAYEALTTKRHMINLTVHELIYINQCAEWQLIPNTNVLEMMNHFNQ